jgi:ABC-type multidrug transport system fused ATPase/permease subunit
LSSFERVLVLCGGKIVGDGSRDSFIVSRSPYARLFASTNPHEPWL